MTNANSFLLLDSCVIFDFMKADGELFTLASRYVGPVYVADALIPELQDFCGVEEIEEVGLRTLEVDKSDLDAASTLSETGPLSYYDVVCLLTARRLGCVCVTNVATSAKRANANKSRCSGGLNWFFGCSKRAESTESGRGESASKLESGTVGFRAKYWNDFLKIWKERELTRCLIKLSVDRETGRRFFYVRATSSAFIRRLFCVYGASGGFERRGAFRIGDDFLRFVERVVLDGGFFLRSTLRDSAFVGQNLVFAEREELVDAGGEGFRCEGVFAFDQVFDVVEKARKQAFEPPNLRLRRVVFATVTFDFRTRPFGEFFHVVGSVFSLARSAFA